MTHNKIHADNIKGMLYMFSATLLFGIADATAKYLAADLPLLQLAWLRASIGLVILLIFVISSKQISALKTSRPLWHFFRSFLGLIILTAIFYSLKHIPLAEVTAIIFSVPFITALFSRWLLNENVSRESWIAIAIGFIGILIVMRPSADHFHIAHAVTLCFSTALALLTVTARRLSNTESILALNVYIYPLMIIATCYWVLNNWHSPDMFQWGLIFLLAITATSALGMIILAMQHAKPSIVAPIDYFRMLWGIILGYSIWGDIPDSYTWAGIILIMLTGIYVVRHKGRTIQQPD